MRTSSMGLLPAALSPSTATWWPLLAIPLKRYLSIQVARASVMAGPGAAGFPIANFRLPIVLFCRQAGGPKDGGKLFCLSDKVAHTFPWHHLGFYQKLEPE